MPRGGKRKGAGRPALPADKARTARAVVRLTPGEFEDWKAQADEAGLSLSAWVRRMVSAA